MKMQKARTMAEHAKTNFEEHRLATKEGLMELKPLLKHQATKEYDRGQKQNALYLHALCLLVDKLVSLLGINSRDLALLAGDSEKADWRPVNDIASRFAQMQGHADQRISHEDEERLKRFLYGENADIDIDDFI